jgi:serine/threonine-protein kinase HipA
MRIEYAYSLLARIAGIIVPESHLLSERDYAHFLVRRFDRMGNARVHQHTLGGMLHIDYNLPGACSYEMYLRTILRLGLGSQALDEAFRRVVFNIAAVNQDDHVKNFSFLMDGDVKWALSPAYDLTYARGHGWTRQHQMSLRGKSAGESITRADLLDLANEFGPGRRAPAIIDQVLDSLSGWDAAAAEAGVPNDWRGRIRTELRERRVRLGKSE